MYSEVLQFWFEECDRSDWWLKSEEFDRLIAHRFGEMNLRASKCELYSWRTEPKGRLAEIILLDQFSRNIFREYPESFDNDALALALAQQAVSAGADKLLSQDERNFLYMPYMHSESLIIHEESVRLYEDNKDSNSLDFELRHKKIIDQFGRYPHRNKMLGRESTKAEVEFLKQPGSSF